MAGSASKQQCAGPIPAMTAHGGGGNQNFPTTKPSATTTKTTVVGTYVKLMHYITDLSPQQLKFGHISQSNLEINPICKYQSKRCNKFNYFC